MLTLKSLLYLTKHGSLYLVLVHTLREKDEENKLVKVFIKTYTQILSFLITFDLDLCMPT